MNILIISENSELIAAATAVAGRYPETAGAVYISSYSAARGLIVSGRPDTVILDIDSPAVSDPAEYLVRLKPKNELPVIVCTSKPNMKYTMVCAGAIDVISKDDVKNPRGYFRIRLGESLKLIKRSVSVYRANSDRLTHKVIAIGGSAGSTQALPVILKEFDDDCPPIVCTIHMPKGYTKLYAQSLNAEVNISVAEAKNGMYLTSGQAVICEGGRHLRLFRDKKGYFITSEEGVKVSGHCPSVDVLFDSAAYAAKGDAVGVILTGMGSDGAKGLANMKRNGAYTIGQDEKTSLVYGMPKEAFEIGGVTKQLPLEEIGSEIKRHFGLGV